jgi:RimJ/RimL family protein N-acetyltransferase
VSASGAPLPESTAAKGTHVVLRAARPEELRRLFEWYEDPDIVAPFDTFDTEPYEEFERLMREAPHDPASTAPRFVIARAEDDRAIGFVGYYRAHPVLEIWDLWYVIADTAERGHGRGREAVGLLIDRLFEVLPGPRIGATTDVENVPSYRLLEGLGFRREGRLASVLFHHNRWHDVYVYGLTREAWRARDRSPAPAGT